jgi:hypothetical protein
VICSPKANSGHSKHSHSKKSKAKRLNHHQSKDAAAANGIRSNESSVTKSHQHPQGSDNQNRPITSAGHDGF